jgi:hypothetical protein
MRESDLYIEETWEDGTCKISAKFPEKHGKGYIAFLPDGTFQIGRSSEPDRSGNPKLLPEKESAYQKISAKDRRPEAVGLLSMLESNPLASGGEAIERLRKIVREPSDLTAARLIDELSSDLKIARKWNRSNGGSQSVHDLFVSALRQLIKLRKGKPSERLPTKRDIANTMEITQDSCSKLCRANGFAWLPNADSGRRS